MTRERTGPADFGGPVLAGILSATTAEDVLRYGFDEAQRRAAPLRVLVAEPATADLGRLIETISRWAEKYPDVASVVSVRTGLDAAIALAAGARGCGLIVVAETADARTEAVLRAVARRVRCPLKVVPQTA
jgi:hypothetical protein